MVTEGKLIFAQLLTDYTQGKDTSELIGQVSVFIPVEDLSLNMEYIDHLFKTILGQMSQGQIDIEQAKLDAQNLYAACGFEKFIEYKYVQPIIDLRFDVVEINYGKSEDRVAILKNIYEVNKSCPVAEVKNSIVKMCFNTLVNSALMPYDVDFAQELVDTVSALSEEDREAVNVLPSMLRIRFSA